MCCPDPKRLVNSAASGWDVTDRSSELAGDEVTDQDGDAIAGQKAVHPTKATSRSPRTAPNYYPR